MMAKTLSQAIAELLQAHEQPHISTTCFGTSARDGWEMRIDGGTQEERTRINDLVNALVAGWHAGRQAEIDEQAARERDIIKLRDISAPL
jgi:hypothetical protein